MPRSKLAEITSHFHPFQLRFLFLIYTGDQVRALRRHRPALSACGSAQTAPACSCWAVSGWYNGQATGRAGRERDQVPAARGLEALRCGCVTPSSAGHAVLFRSCTKGLAEARQSAAAQAAAVCSWVAGDFAPVAADPAPAQVQARLARRVGACVCLIAPPAVASRRRHRHQSPVCRVRELTGLG
jgi:hypothetical protein